MVKPGHFLLAILTVVDATYILFAGKTSYAGHGGTEIDSDSTAPTGLTVPSCEARCDADAVCTCVSFRPSDGKCWKRSDCTPTQFGTDSTFNTYVKHSPYEVYRGMTIYNGHGGTEIDSDTTAPSGLPVANCQGRCDGDAACDCVSFRPSDGKCWKRSTCVPSQFGSDGNFDTYVKQTGPSPPTPPPAPTGRLGSFLVIGDWGHDASVHGNIISDTCQKSVGNAMASTMSELGDVKFIVNVGDSFYPNGVSSKYDSQWDEKWRNVYPTQVRSVPWYSVMGNHDYHKDPGACSDTTSDGAQINGDVNDLNTFYMPDYSWYKAHPELQLEVVAMDLNNYQDGWNHKISASQQKFADCQYTACSSSCYSRMKVRAEQSFQLFKARAAASTAKNLLVFSHYPTDYFWDHSSGDVSDDFIAELSASSKHHVEYFGGHRHDVDQTSTLSIAPNNNWLSGGGGGWGCDGSKQGFVVGEISVDGTITTRAVLVDPGLCCNHLGLSNDTLKVEFV